MERYVARVPLLSAAAAPVKQGGRVTFDGRDIATVRSVGSSAGVGWRKTQVGCNLGHQYLLMLLTACASGYIFVIV